MGTRLAARVHSERSMTLQTGCEIDVYFVEGTTAEVALNNYVYTLNKL